MENNIPRLSESDPVYVQTVWVTGDNIQMISADVRMHCLCVYVWTIVYSDTPVILQMQFYCLILSQTGMMF